MDIIELLDEYDIEYWTSGKNVSHGWIGLRCPFCEDYSNHLGIHKKSLACRCWKCGKHNLKSVLREVLEISHKEAFKISKRLEGQPGGADETQNSVLSNYASGEKIVAVRLPEESSRRFPKLHTEYLRHRNFAPLKTIRKYRLKAVENLGKYKFRIIIPIIFQGKIVSFTSRDVTGMASIPYLAADQKRYPNPKHFLYNIDSIPKGGNAVLVEGPTDVWRLGDGAISCLGVEHHETQLVHLYKKKVNTLFVLYDNDEPGRRASRMIAKRSIPFVNQVEIVKLNLEGVNDPGEMSKEEAEILMEELDFIVTK